MKSCLKKSAGAMPADILVIFSAILPAILPKWLKEILLLGLLFCWKDRMSCWKTPKYHSSTFYQDRISLFVEKKTIFQFFKFSWHEFFFPWKKDCRHSAGTMPADREKKSLEKKFKKLKNIFLFVFYFNKTFFGKKFR